MLKVDWLMIVAVMCAYIIKGICGFANTLIFSTIVSFRSSTIEITPIELLVGYPANLVIAWRERKEINSKVWIPLAGMVIVGSIPGIFFLKVMEVSSLKILLGIIIIAVSIEMYLREKYRNKSKGSAIVLFIIGIISGVLCGLFGIGALLAAYIGRTTDNAKAFRGNLCVVFLIENTFRIVVYSIMGIINKSTCNTAITMLPFMLVGLGIGICLSKKIEETKVKKVVIFMLILSGVSLIIKNVI